MNDVSQKTEINWRRVDLLISMALDEDLGDAGDVTTLSVIPENITVKGVLLAKEDLVCAGLEIAFRVFQKLDDKIYCESKVKDGDFCPKGTILAEMRGNARAVLTAERTALNFIQRLCGIATISRKYAESAKMGGKSIILDTRKTTPGWRNLEKYAVAIGGASNHRIGLFDRILIKDNHREIAGMEGAYGINRSILQSRALYPQLEIEVEADELSQVKEAVESGADYILLDNMTNEQMAEAVAMVKNRSRLEASGGITLERVKEISALGVDFISVGALTHSVKSSDISLDIIAENKGV